MKATGIVRRTDDLDRVVIPKELAAPCAFRKGLLTVNIYTIRHISSGTIDFAERITGEY